MARFRGGTLPNRLADATSPYLLQHADNPVDWYPWGEEAMDEARRSDKPILLSVGYAACHWCHVMAHESFESPDIAAVMNRHFVNVKVDREERPDVDRIYMDAVQAMTGHGGWPMTVFLTPDGKPFYAGTYFPPNDRGQFPGFPRVLEAVADAWANRRADIEAQADQLTGAVQDRIPPGDAPPRPEIVDAAVDYAGTIFDDERGGFGTAPKFPQAPMLELLLRTAATGHDEARRMLESALDAMAGGGIHDHLGGGFARYSVDAAWAVPHFEKMLYDNALLARVYAWGSIVVDRPDFGQVAQRTLDYMLTDLAVDGGGLASSEDADSEGREGTYYVFTHDEVVAATGDDAPVAIAYFGVTPEGNFEGANVLSVRRTIDEVARELDLAPAEAAAAVERARSALTEHRATRERPARDDKVVTAWNGLAIRALAESGAVLGEPGYVDAALRCASFVLDNLVVDGTLMRSWRAGRTSVPAFAEDHAALAAGLFALYQVTGTGFAAGSRLLDELTDRFSDEAGGFFTTPRDGEALIVRPKDLMDNPTPSANALAAEAFRVRGLLTGSEDDHEIAEGVLAAAGPLMASYPSAAGHLLAVRHTLSLQPTEVVVVGEDRADLVAEYWSAMRPAAVLVQHDGDEREAEVAVLEGRLPHDGPAVAYVCHRHVCAAPTADPLELAKQLAS